MNEACDVGTRSIAHGEKEKAASQPEGRRSVTEGRRGTNGEIRLEVKHAEETMEGIAGGPKSGEADEDKGSASSVSEEGAALPVGH